MIDDNEPSLEKIDDYNGKETKEKKRIIWIVVMTALIIGAVIAYFNQTSKVKDSIDTVPVSSNK